MIDKSPIKRVPQRNASTTLLRRPSFKHAGVGGLSGGVGTADSTADKGVDTEGGPAGADFWSKYEVPLLADCVQCLVTLRNQKLLIERLAGLSGGIFRTISSRQATGGIVSIVVVGKVYGMLK